jgi:hypothetical protein
MLETHQTLATHDKQQIIAPIIAPANARVKLRQRSPALVGNSHISITAGRRSRERHSPEWRPANRQSGEWRSRIFNLKFPNQLRNSGLLGCTHHRNSNRKCGMI